MATTAEGLRERRRRQTRRDIHAAALRLATEQGFEKITVEMISSEAGVSPRTVFNYFPSKEAAVLYGPDELSADKVARFVAAGPAHPRRMLADLTTLLVADLSNFPERREMQCVLALTRKNPTVLAAHLARFDAFRTSLAEAVAQRLGQRADDEVPGMIAALAMAAVRTGLERWSRGEPADTEDTPVPYVERSVALMRTLLVEGDRPVLSDL